MVKCKKCHHDCHCDGDLHSDEYGLCACEKCECKNGQDKAEDSTYENNGSLVIDDPEKCESCQ